MTSVLTRIFADFCSRFAVGSETPEIFYCLQAARLTETQL